MRQNFEKKTVKPVTKETILLQEAESWEFAEAALRTAPSGTKLKKTPSKYFGRSRPYIIDDVSFELPYSFIKAGDKIFRVEKTDANNKLEEGVEGKVKFVKSAKIDGDQLYVLKIKRQAIHPIHFLEKEIELEKQIGFLKEHCEINYQTYLFSLYQGKDLFAYLDSLANKPLSFDQKEALAIKVIYPLLELHKKKKIVHRDLKLENITINQEGIVNYIDYGAAEKKPDGPFVTMRGTQHYLPSQPTGEKKSLIDFFALLRVLYMPAIVESFDNERLTTNTYSIFTKADIKKYNLEFLDTTQDRDALKNMRKQRLSPLSLMQYFIMDRCAARGIQNIDKKLLKNPEDILFINEMLTKGLFEKNKDITKKDVILLKTQMTDSSQNIQKINGTQKEQENILRNNQPLKPNNENQPFKDMKVNLQSIETLFRSAYQNLLKIENQKRNFVSRFFHPSSQMLKKDALAIIDKAETDFAKGKQSRTLRVFIQEGLMSSQGQLHPEVLRLKQEAVLDRLEAKKPARITL